MAGWLRFVLLGAAVFLLGAIAGSLWLLSSSVPNPIAQPSPTAVPTTAPTPPPAVATEPAATPATGGLAVGSGAEVFNTGQCLNVRENPSLSGRAVDCLADGTRLNVTGGPTVADGVTWWQVSRASVASQGWVSGQYLRPLAP